MNLNSWDYHELSKEVVNSSIAQLLEIYKREEQKYSEKCKHYFDMQGSLTEEGRKEIVKQCEFLEGGKFLVALEIADRLTKTK